MILDLSHDNIKSQSGNMSSKWNKGTWMRGKIKSMMFLCQVLPGFSSIAFVCQRVFKKMGKRDQLEWVISSLNESSQISFIKIFPTFQTPDTLKTVSNYESNGQFPFLTRFILTLLAY